MSNKLTIIQAGESLPFLFDRGGDAISGWVCTISVKVHPDDAAILTRVIPALDSGWPGLLTNSETSGLSVGLHYLIAVIADVITDEEEQVVVRFHITKAWA